MHIVETPYPLRISARFTTLVDGNADTQTVSDAIVTVLLDMDAALSPIIGRQNFLALLNRSIALADMTFQWLGISHEATDVETSLAALRSALALSRHGTYEAAACGVAVVTTLHGSLTALIGQSLTERLLHNVGRTPQDNSL